MRAALSLARLLHYDIGVVSKSWSFHTLTQSCYCRGFAARFAFHSNGIKKRKDWKTEEWGWRHSPRVTPPCVRRLQVKTYLQRSLDRQCGWTGRETTIIISSEWKRENISSTKKEAHSNSAALLGQREPSLRWLVPLQKNLLSAVETSPFCVLTQGFLSPKEESYV